MQIMRTKWLEARRLSAGNAAKLRMILFPPAGSDISIYYRWENYFPPEVELLLVRLPGRGGRSGEKLISDGNILVRAMLDDIRDELRKPYVIFGHSMGALLTYLMAKEIFTRQWELPECLFLSSLKAPARLSGINGCFNGINKQGTCLYQMDDMELGKKIGELGGVPDLVWQDQEFFSMILPIFRNDLRLCETYYSAAEVLFPIPLELLGGNQDKLVTKEELAEWKDYSSKPASMTIFQGGHFYFHENMNIFTFTISQKLMDIMGRHKT